MSDYVFFWNGPFSQWYHSPFELEGLSFVTAEQWMMWNKAMLFNDISTAGQIMLTQTPREQKALGRRVKNFNDEEWMKHAYDIVVVGNTAKFISNGGLLPILGRTRGKTLVEASPYDRRWGIGMSANDPGVEDPKNWKGENLLGKAITQVRINLLGD